MEMGKSNESNHPKPDGMLKEGKAVTDIKNPKLLYLKGAMMLAIGCLGFGLVVMESPTWRVAALMAISIWGFCRAYYFAFYVIEHYVDPQYRFAGLTAFVRYVMAQRISLKNSQPNRHPE
jgi:hypothetical protein